MEESDFNPSRGEEALICNACDKIVRPVDRSGDGFLACPFCECSLEHEVDRFNRRYGLKPDMETAFPDEN